MKAIASGNPLVIEKANVDAELARLTRLRSQHVEANYRLRSQVRHLTDEIPRLEQRLEALRQDLARRVDTRGDRFSIQLGTQLLSDRGIAGELLNRLGERSRGLMADKLVGRFAGFDLLISPMLDNEVQLLLRGAAQHSVRLQATAHGTTRAVEHVLMHLDETAGQAEEIFAQSRKRLADLRTQVDQPFEYGFRLAKLVQRQQELVAKLDLHRNSAGTADTAETPMGEAGTC